MNDFMAARKRLHIYAKELHEMADDIADESDGLQMALAAVLERAALVADQVGATASPGDGKETADEIGRRIRALMERRDGN